MTVRVPCLGGEAEVALRAGVVWVAFSDAGWPAGHPAARPWVSRACGPMTAAELRHLADTIDALTAGGV